MTALRRGSGGASRGGSRPTGSGTSVQGARGQFKFLSFFAAFIPEFPRDEVHVRQRVPIVGRMCLAPRDAARGAVAAQRHNFSRFNREIFFPLRSTSTPL